MCRSQCVACPHPVGWFIVNDNGSLVQAWAETISSTGGGKGLTNREKVREKARLFFSHLRVSKVVF